MKNPERTEEKIKTCFLELMENKKWNRISVKELCSYMRIQRSTFYYYFENCEKLLEVIEKELLSQMCFYQRSEDRMLHDITPIPSVIAWFTYCMEHRFEYAVLMGENGDPAFTNRFREQICEEINRLMDDEGMPKGTLRPFCVELFYSIHESLLKFAFRTVETELSLTPEQLAGLANNWRAFAIFNERGNGIPITAQDFKQVYEKKVN